MDTYVVTESLRSDIVTIKLSVSKSLICDTVAVEVRSSNLLQGDLITGSAPL